MDLCTFKCLMRCLKYSNDFEHLQHSNRCPMYGSSWMWVLRAWSFNESIDSKDDEHKSQVFSFSQCLCFIWTSMLCLVRSSFEQISQMKPFLGVSLDEVAASIVVPLTLLMWLILRRDFIETPILSNRNSIIFSTFRFVVIVMVQGCPILEREVNIVLLYYRVYLLWSTTSDLFLETSPRIHFSRRNFGIS